MSACVIKVGGALLETESASQQFFTNLAGLDGYQPVLVHGGGAQVAALLDSLGFGTEKKNGLRITPPDQMPIVAGALAGTVNKTLVAHAGQAELRAVGLSVLDGNMVSAEQLDPELGNVGQPTGHDATLLNTLLAQNWLPIIASIGKDASGQLLNINADHAAAAIAHALACPLILLSDVPAVLDADKNRIQTITPANLPELIQQQIITDGMLVKVEAAMDTATKTGCAVIIAGWRDNLTNILAGIAGTQILPE